MEHRSFEQIYLQYYKPVYAYLMTLCQNEELAAELTQETFYKALDAIDGFKGGCALNVWLCQIAKNTLTDTYRRQKRELPPLDDTLTDVPSPAPLPGEELEKREGALSLYQKLHARTVPGGVLAAGLRRTDLCRDRRTAPQDRKLGAGDLLPRPNENEGGHLMKLPCYLVQDLLPLYKDHVCDEQTSADVAEHLSDCAACSALLAEMDAPPQETAVQEEQAAEAAEALSTVKKNLRARQVKITLAAVGGLLALICAFFGWRYWMMHSYVDLPVEDLVVEETHEVLPSDSYGSIHTIQKNAVRNAKTGVYYTTVGYQVRYYRDTPIVFLSVTQTRWEALMRTFSKNNEPIWIEVSSPYTLFVTRDTYLTLRAARLMPEQDELIDILADDATLTRYDGGFSWTDTSKTISILLEQVRFAKVRARKTP